MSKTASAKKTRATHRPSRIVRLLGLLILFGSFAGAWLIMDYQSFLTRPLKVGEQGLIYTVRPGSSLTAIALDLSRLGVLDTPRYLVWRGRLTGKANSVKAGEYQLMPGSTPLDLIGQLVAGKVVLHTLTLVEGWNFREVISAVNAHEALTHSLADLNQQQIMTRLGHPDEHPEGRFFPETYRFPRGTTDVDFLKRAYEAMTQHLEAAWRQRDADLPYQNPYEALIMASIVEKETAVPEERAQIAGVFVRRLKKGMRLQTDPSVIYGLGETFDGNIRSRDLRSDTPYNTYTRSGLPPTPIAMPGAAAIQAALHPAPGNALYFVAKGDGTHHFSATLEQHNAAVAKYQLKSRK